MILKYLAPALAIVAATSSNPAQVSVTNPLTASSLKAKHKNAQIIDVCKDSSLCYSTICGGTASSATSDCAAGSAIAAITDSALAKPYIVRIGPGVYDDVTVIKDKTDITLLLEGATITSTATTTIDGGVLRIAPSGNTTDAVRISVIGNGTFRNNRVNAVDAGCQVGPEAGPGASTAADWDHVYFGPGIRCEGVKAGFNAYGSNLANDDNPPVLTLDGTFAGSQGDAYLLEGTINVRAYDIVAHAFTNYCVGTALGVASGTIAATGNTTTKANLGTGASAVSSSYIPRVLTLASCDAAGSYASSAYNGTTKLLTTTLMAAAPDPNCTWSIAAPPNSGVRECTESWLDAMSSPTATTATGIRMGSAVDPNSASIALFERPVIRVEINNGYSSAGTPAGTAVWWDGAAVGADPIAEKVIFNDADIRVDFNYASTGTLAGSVGLAGFYITGDANDNNESLEISGLIQMRNPGEVSVDLYGYVEQGAVPSGFGTGYLRNLTFDLTSSVGSFVGLIRDIGAADNNYNELYASNLASLANGGVLRVVASLDGEGITLPTKYYSGAQKSVASLGGADPLWSVNSAAWTSADLFCALTPVPNGTGNLTNASINVQTAGAAGKLCSVCVYDLAGEQLVAEYESIDCDGPTGEINAPDTTDSVNALWPGNFWVCIGSNADADLILKGKNIATRGTSIVGRLGTGADTCPATIDPSAMTAVTGAVPEAVLLP